MLPHFEKRGQLGSFGENAVANVYVRRGARVLARNYKTRFGEIDLIIEKPRSIAAVEVKTRTVPAGKPKYTFGRPAEAVGRARIERLEQTLILFAQAEKYSGLLQIDVAEVLVDARGSLLDIQILENVTK
ncbi:MAG: YraN family protein [Planctomycetota bacterium]